MQKVIFENQSKVFERTTRGADGRFFRVRFVVVERNGVVRGRIISIEPIATIQKRFRIYDSRQNATGGQVGFKKKATYLLPRFLQQLVKVQESRIKDFYISPYFNIFELLIGSQPTRAPSLCTKGSTFLQSQG